MILNFSKSSKALGAGALAGAALCVSLASLPAQAQVASSYKFMGLDWGMSQKAVRAALAKRRFRVIRHTRGAQKEFSINKFHGKFQRVNRGRRLVAVGRVAGQPVFVDFVFGDNDKLAHVIVKSRWWNRTVRGARKIITLSKTLIEMYAERYGAPKVIQDDGWPDTASWQPAGDGSRLHVFVRGEKGFMFSPSYKTGLRVHFYNPNIRSDRASLMMGGGILPEQIKGAATLAKRYRRPPPKKLSKKEHEKKEKKDFGATQGYND
jgi:hypothetical protein